MSDLDLIHALHDLLSLSDSISFFLTISLLQNIVCLFVTLWITNLSLSLVGLFLSNLKSYQFNIISILDSLG